jgi:hypothetical protein
LTFRQALRYLFQEYKISSSSAKNISFDNLSQMDPDYQLFKVAYYLKMIGRNINPDAQVRCTTYIVMK